jgi:hypothetical protein
MQRIADADTLLRKWGVELHVMTDRRKCEMKMKEPIDDEYGILSFYDCLLLSFE